MFRDRNVQHQHGIGEATGDGEDREQSDGAEKHEFASNNVTQLRIDNEET